MILKEKELINPSDPRQKAGEDAEKQMAFYLQRAFRKRDDCFVINDLRVIHDGDVAQIDHLVVSPFGLFIVESKSVHGTISINQHGDWKRTYGNDITGMPSPVLQAQEQGRILKELLRENTERVLGKFLFGKVQKGFHYCPISTYVAISDSGIIERGMDIPELFKADVVAGAITKQIAGFESKANLISPKNLLSIEVAWAMTKQEAKATAEFLVSQHQPMLRSVPANEENKKSFPEQIETTFVPKVGAMCPKCNAHKLVRKSVSRSDGTETDYLACEGYPSSCNALFPLVAISSIPRKSEAAISVVAESPTAATVYIEGHSCPRCKDGKLVRRKGKTKFLGCSNFPKCKFTDYRDTAN